MDTTVVSSGGPIAGWLIFIAILLGICVVLTPLVLWFALGRKKGKRRRRHRHHDHYRRQVNPTLAETGGLPPPRPPNQPPPGL